MAQESSRNEVMLKSFHQFQQGNMPWELRCVSPPVPSKAGLEAQRSQKKILAPFLLIWEKRKQPNTSRKHFRFRGSCLKGMTIFLCRRPCPVKCDSLFNWGQGQRKKMNISVWSAPLPRRREPSCWGGEIRSIRFLSACLSRVGTGREAGVSLS